MNRRSGRDSQEILLLLLDVHELLPELKGLCLDYAVLARLCSSLRPEMTSEEEWANLYWIIDECERDYEQMVMRLRLDRVILFGVYQRMSSVKTAWLEFVMKDCSQKAEPVSEEMLEKQNSELNEERKMWEPILSNIKKMLVASH